MLEKTLLALKRQYSKDETVALLTARLKEVEYENGVLKSELAEAQDMLKAAEKTNREEDFKAALKGMKTLTEKCAQGLVERNKWRNLAMSLQAKYEPLQK